MSEREYPPAGRAMDWQIATRLMGLVTSLDAMTGERSCFRAAGGVLIRQDNRQPALQRCPIPHFSTDIGAAWEVRNEAIRRRWDINVMGDALPSALVEITWRTNQSVAVHCEVGEEPYAICRAALRALDAAAGEGGEG